MLVERGCYFRTKWKSLWDHPEASWPVLRHGGSFWRPFHISECTKRKTVGQEAVYLVAEGFALQSSRNLLKKVEEVNGPNVAPDDLKEAHDVVLLDRLATLKLAGRKEQVL